MPRVISFLVLLAIVLLVGAVFYRVMAQFLVPLFLACVLLVVFQPLHVQIRKRLPKYPRISALITTVLIVLAVVLPLIWVGWNAYVELVSLAGPLAEEITLAADEPPKLRVEEVQPLEDDELTPWLDKIAFDLRNRLRAATDIAIDDATVRRIVDAIPSLAATVAITAVRQAVSILIGLAIIVIALYYFLADGPEMIQTVMYFSPLDSSYERELLDRFGQVSRAVVLATLLTAVVQGALAGIGFVFALPAAAPIFLLVALTMLTALVPFIGAAVVWIPACAWVYFYGPRVVAGEVVQGSPVTAIVLALYCAVFVSGIDNVIKPLVLHGQSRLHPLLALLSILGGVTVLGPVGILVGPMLVSFLQALLAMLRKELDRLGVKGGAAGQLATVVDVMPNVATDNEHPPPSEAETTKSEPIDGRRTEDAKSPPPSGSPAAARRSKRKRGR